MSARRFFFSDFLVADDAIFLARGVFDEPLPSRWLWENDWINLVTTLFASIIAAKILALVMVAATAGSLSWLLYIPSRRALPAILAAAAITVFPFSREAGVFVTGSHAYFAAPFALSGAALLVSSGLRSEPSYTILGGATGLFTLAGLMSPTAVALSLAPVAFLCLKGLLTWRISRHDVVGGVFSLAAATWTLYRSLSYHYSGLEGWTSLSPATAARNLQYAVNHVYKGFVDSGPARPVLGIAIVVVMGCFVLGVRHRVAVPDRDAWMLPLFLISCVGLALAPGFAVVNYTARYATIAFLFAASVPTLVLLGASAVWQRKALSVATSAGLVALVLGTAVASYHFRLQQYGTRLEAFKIIERVVDQESSAWPSGAQVVILMPVGTPSPSSGYNHWSTWMIRYLAGRDDITGLAGPESALASRPFVSSYRDFGPEYWVVRDGVSARVPMMGVTIDAPLYIYRASTDAARPSAALPVTFASPDEEVTVPVGGTVSGALVDPTTQTEVSNALLWPVNADELPAASRIDPPREVSDLRQLSVREPR